MNKKEKKANVEVNKELDNSNMDNKSQITEFICLYFYNPNCSHCKYFNITFDETIKTIINIEFKKIDVTMDHALCTQYKIVATPTVIFLENNDELNELRMIGDNPIAFNESLRGIKDKILSSK